VKSFRFLPTEENFFEVFDEMAQILVDAAASLQELINNYENIVEKTLYLRSMEKKADEATTLIFSRLNVSFVTPIDREDIHALAASMDDVLDYIEASADRMKLYGVDKPREEAAELAALLVEGTKQIQKGVHAVSDFRDIESILQPCIEINKVENQGDEVQRRALARLFREEAKPLEIAKWQEIFDRLETATDRCEDVANVLESIVVKNA
jgi:hypothetical protein